MSITRWIATTVFGWRKKQVLHNAIWHHGRRYQLRKPNVTQAEAEMLEERYRGRGYDVVRAPTPRGIGIYVSRNRKTAE